MSLVPNDTEQVVYKYTGDVTSLRKATEQALGFLDSYQKHIDRISNDGGFGKSTKAAKSFQSVMKSVTKDVTTIQSKMKSLTDVKLFSGTDVQKQIATSLGGMNQIKAKLQSSTGLTTKEVQALTSQLKASKQSLQASGAGIDTLVAKEVKFQHTLEVTKAKVEQFRNTMDSIKGRVSSAFDPLISKMNSLRNPFARLSQTVQIFKAKAQDSFGRISQVVSTVASAFRRVSNSEEDASNSATRTSKAHNALSSVLTKLRSLFTRETEAIEDEEDTLDKKNKTLNSSNKQHRSLGSVLSSLLGIFNREAQSIRNISNNFTVMSRSSNLARDALRGLTGVQLGRWLAESVKQSISYIENLNLFAVSTGEAYEESLKFVNSMSELYGMDPSNLMRYAGNFYQLADAISMPDKASAALSLGLTKATNDIASLFNVDVETVFENLSSGMQGMSRAVRKYGMDIRTTTLQQTALSLGLTEHVRNVSEANRQGLRFITMMRQASNASGDFARTIESPANQLRIFTEQVTQLGRAIGNFLIGPLGSAIQHINGFVMALRMVLQFLGSVFGVLDALGGHSGGAGNIENTLDNVASGVSSIGSSAKDAARELKSMLAPFDELNILQATETGTGDDGGLGDVGTLDPAILTAIEEMQWKLDEVEMKAVKVRNAILAFLGFKVDEGAILSWNADVLEQNLINKFPQWTKTIQATFDYWSSIVNSFGEVLKALGGVAQAVWSSISDTLSSVINDDTLSAFVEQLPAHLGSLASFIEANKSSLADFVVTVSTLAVAFRGFSAIGTLVEPIITFISTCARSLASFASVLNIVTAVIAAIAVLYTSSDKFADSFNSLIVSIGTGLGNIFAAFWNTLQTVWQGIQNLWQNNIQPMITEIGNGLAPVLNTVISLWETLGAIVVDLFGVIQNIWTSVLEPVLGSFFDAVGKLAQIFGTLWSEWVGPVLEHVGNSLSQLWANTLKPVIENIMGIIGSLAVILLSLWNDVLAPVVNWIANTLGPIIVSVFNSVWSTIESAVVNIGRVVNGLIRIIQGILDFVAGVFTGDWKRAWQGILDIFKGIWDTIAGVLSIPINVIIGGINLVLSGITGAINSVVRAINSISVDIPSWVPLVGGKHIGFNLREVSTWSIPYLAEGAVVKSPTLAMIGEGKYDEAVIPLGDSPQMSELVNRIANARSESKGPDDDAVPVQVFLDGDVLFEGMAKRARAARLRTGMSIF